MKTRILLLLSVLLTGLAIEGLYAQTPVTVIVTPSADAYTTCNSVDTVNYGTGPYVKVAYNTLVTNKYNGFLRFRMPDDLFANLSKVTSIEFGIYSDATGQTTSRQVKVSYIPISAASPNTLWIENQINGVFRSGMGLGSGTANTSLFYFTKAAGDAPKFYTNTSTATTNSSLYNAIVTTYKAQQEINFRLYPNETFTTDGKNPQMNDSIGINFVSKDNTNFDSSFYPYLKFTYTNATGLLNEKSFNPTIIAKKDEIQILNLDETFGLKVFDMVGNSILTKENLQGNTTLKVKLPLGIYIFNITAKQSKYSSEILIKE